MSEPVSKAEVEDVLSSIRKLVTDEPVQAEPRPAAPAQPVLVAAADPVNTDFSDTSVTPSSDEQTSVAPAHSSWNSRFVLMPENRVEAAPTDVETAIAATEPHVESPTAALEPSAADIPPVVANLNETSPAVTDVEAEMSAESLDNDTLTAETPGAVLDFAQLAEAPITDFVEAESPAEVNELQRLEDRVAHMETAISAQDGEWEPDGSEADELAGTSMPEFVDTPATAAPEVYVLGASEAVPPAVVPAQPAEDEPTIAEDLSTEAADMETPSASEPLVLVAAAAVPQADIILEAGSISSEEPEGAAVAASEAEIEPSGEIESQVQGFNPEELITEEQVAADIEAALQLDLMAQEETVPEAEATLDEPQDAEVTAEPVAETAEQIEEPQVEDTPVAEISDETTEVDLVAENDPVVDDAVEDTETESTAIVTEAGTADAISEDQGAVEQIIEEVVLDEVISEIAVAAPETTDAAVSDTADMPSSEDAAVQAVEAIVATSVSDDGNQDNTSAEAEEVETEAPVTEASSLLMDEERLREIVSDVVREELRGALGERITRNMRKMVRREIHRTVTARDV